MTHPVEDNESLNSNQIHFCFAKSFWCDYVYLFKIKQIQLAAGENFGNFFLHFRLQGSNLAMKLPSKISFVIFFNSAYEISFTFLAFSSNFLNFYKNFFKLIFGLSLILPMGNGFELL